MKEKCKYYKDCKLYQSNAVTCNEDLTDEERCYCGEFRRRRWLRE